MKVLAIGDLVGNVGLKKFEKEYKELKEKENIDFCIVNAENVNDGFGITEKDFRKLVDLNVDCITMGNHTWGKKDIFGFIDSPKIIRPANYPSNNPGKGYRIYKCNGKKIAVINLIGRVEMGILSDSPFEVSEKIIEQIRNEVDIIIIDFHAEATAEKLALRHYLDGKANIIFGTHTHVETADEFISEKGTAYITDIGMTGPKNSIIGMDPDVALKRFLTSIPERYKSASGEAKLRGCIFEINDENCRVKNIRRVKID